MEKALIAMSGGVDSSVAALLMQETGCECAGATMQLFRQDAEYISPKSCGSPDDAADAKAAAQRLGMTHYLFDFTEQFREHVMQYFADCYACGMTPNPCIECNRFLKFHAMIQRMQEMGYDYIVTGHYARVEYDSTSGRYLLKTAVDQTKDQSYVLYSLTQEQLRHVRFPLGSYHKTEIRAIAERHGFLNAHKKESQDICFVPDGDYAAFLKRFTGRTYTPGAFVDTNGQVLGEHRGIIHYTIGQRKGLGISGSYPFYVCGIDADSNKVILGENADLFSDTVTAKNVNLISVPEITEPIRVTAKIRYRHRAQPATAWTTPDGQLHVRFDEPQRAVTKGQSVVMYQNDVVVGGGTIV